jgi:Flp pilus assembly protein TadG
MSFAKWITGISNRLIHENWGNQIAEFAVTLPLLLVLAVGIFDFGAAFTVKEKLVSIAQTGARVGASQPANDLSVTSTACNQLVAVCAVRDVVDRALLDNNLKDCGLGSRSPAAGPGTLTWTFTANSGCPAALKVKIERGYVYTTTLAPPFDTNPMQIVGTRVTVTYPYQWQLSKVLSLLNGNFNGPANLTTVATMENIN